MGEFVGVLRLTDSEGRPLDPLPSLKREALFFDKLAVLELGALLSARGLDEAVAADLEWLADKGIVLEPHIDYEGLGRPPVLRPDRVRMMMALDVDATACLSLTQQGYEAVPIVGSRSDLAERFLLDLDPKDQEFLR